MDAGAQDIAHFPKQIDWIGELVREAVDRVGGGETVMEEKLTPQASVAKSKLGGGFR